MALLLPSAALIRKGDDWKRHAQDLVSALALGLDGITEEAAARAQSVFPEGAAAPFPQSAAPRGWVLDAAHHDRLLRVVSGSGGGVGGSWSIRGCTAAGAALTLDQMPTHAHTGTIADASHSHGGVMGTAAADHQHTGTTDTQANHNHATATAGSAGGHIHSITSFNPLTNGFAAAASAANSTFASNPAGAHSHSTITINAAGAHTHPISAAANAAHSHSITVAASGAHTHISQIGLTAGGNAHQHALSSDGSWRPSYLDVILCRRFLGTVVAVPGTVINTARVDIELAFYAATITGSATITMNRVDVQLMGSVPAAFINEAIVAGRADIELAPYPASVSVMAGVTANRVDIELAPYAFNVNEAITAARADIEVAPLAASVNFVPIYSILRFETDVTTDDTGRSWTNPKYSATGFARSTSAPKYGTGCATGTAGNDTCNMQTAAIGLPATGATSLTVEAWVKADAYGYVGLGFEDLAAGTGAKFALNINTTSADGKFAMAWIAYDTAGSLIFYRAWTGAVTIDFNWHHLAASYDGTTYRLFFDGTLVDSLVSSTKPCDETTPLSMYLNHIPFFDHNPTGAIDSVRFHSACLYVGTFVPGDIP